MGYNHTRKADKYILSRLFHHLGYKPGQTILDIGCGTGNYTIALNELGIQFIGIDPSDEMLDIAKSKSPGMEWINGKVEDIPLENDAVDGCLATLTLHHWNDMKKGFGELNRVLKQQAKIVIFTSTPAQMETYWLHHYFPKMMRVSTDFMPSLETVEMHLKDAGFQIMHTEKFFVTNELEDLFLQSGKYNPSLYFNERVRKGISSFASLSNKDEEEQGLRKLQDDIASGEIDEIIQKYESDEGDYLFVIAQKI